ncbi:hypothetical protein F6J84_03645 [Microbacterium caowuchunii]|uniref:hypothetical protein n=1 Tax=Microbacterium caowuchunii TaxID=2614638 RepID=UPI0012448A6F|nr:hypothetical protein [Microbacterium caowuchunii]QEV99298.1 hypothetical protein F6J84_03645 [Microbacterium caowuchunii]
MAEQGDAALLRRIEMLEAENTALRAQVNDAPGVTGPDGAAHPAARRRARWWAWTLLATVLIVVGAILAPVAAVSAWAKAVLTDTEGFVSSYAPLAQDPAVQRFVTDQTMLVITQQLDIRQITSDVIDGITDLGTGPRASEALNLLKGPAASGLLSLVESGVSNFVTSDSFADVWASALRVSHTQLLAALQNDPGSAVRLGGDGTVGIQLGPIVVAVKEALIAQGIDIAAGIPTVDRTIVVARSEALPNVQMAYGLTVWAGDWLPWIVIAMLTAGVLVARRRATALICAAVALALSMAVTIAALAVGRILFADAMDPAMLPADVAGRLYEAVATGIRATAVAVLVLAVVVALVGWLAGPFDVPRRLRGLFSAGAARIRGAAEERGLSTGRVGEWLYAQRSAVRVAIAVVFAAVVLFVRPLTPALTIWSLVIAAIALAVLEVVQRPIVLVPEDADVPIRG